MPMFYGKSDTSLVCFIVLNDKPEYWQNKTACRG